MTTSHWLEQSCLSLFRCLVQSHVQAIYSSFHWTTSRRFETIQARTSLGRLSHWTCPTGDSISLEQARLARSKRNQSHDVTTFLIRKACQMMSRLLFLTNIVKYVRFFKA